MNETRIVLTVKHKKPLPPLAAEVIAQRFYMWAYSQGVEVGVEAKRLDDLCRFPNCSCPMDPGPDPDWCAIGLPHVRSEVMG